MTEIEESIFAFVAEERGIEGADLRLDSCLLEDLGLDGDDADEFFEDFGTRFQVDLAVLYDHGHEHFHSEGALIEVTPGCLVCIGAGVAAGYLFQLVFTHLPVWATAIVGGVVFCCVWGAFFERRQKNRKTPITMQDLIDAANAGKWVKPYQRGQ